MIIGRKIRIFEFDFVSKTIIWIHKYELIFQTNLKNIDIEQKFCNMNFFQDMYNINVSIFASYIMFIPTLWSNLFILAVHRTCFGILHNKVY